MKNIKIQLLNCDYFLYKIVTKKNTPFKNGTTFVVNWLAQFKW